MHPSTTKDHPATNRSHTFERADWIVLGALLAAAVLAGRLVLAAPAAVGQWQDDGVYLVTARALAAGEGYRRIDLPGHPWQTKYPILFPALLSLVWRLHPAFPDNVAAMRVLSITLGAGGFWLAYRLMRRAWRLPPLIAGPAVVAAWMNLAWVGLLQTPMSEPLFLLLASGALLMAARHPRAPAAPNGATQDGAAGAADVRRGGLVTTAVAALLAGGAALTRSVGLTVVAALVVQLLWRRRWRDAGVALLIGLTAAGTWHLWRGAAAEQNRANPAAGALRYELDYAAWRPHDAASTLHVAAYNLPAVALALLTSIVPLDAVAVESALRGGGGPLALLLAATGLVVLWIGVGVVATCSRAALAPHAFLALYLALVLVWPFPPDRFITAVQPLVYGLFFAGLGTTLIALLRLFDADGAEQPALAGALARGGLDAYARGARSGWQSARWAGLALGGGLAYLGYGALAQPGAVVDPQTQREQAALADLLRGGTPPDSVIACGHGGYLHLLTGRQFVLFLPIDEPAALLYSADRRWWQCGATFSPAEVDRARRWIEARLEPYLRTSGATHLVLKKDRSLFSVLFREFCESRPATFPRVAEVDAGSLHRFAGGR